MGFEPVAKTSLPGKWDIANDDDAANDTLVPVKITGDEILYLPGVAGSTYTRGDMVYMAGGLVTVIAAANAPVVIGVVTKTTVCPAATQPFPLPGKWDMGDGSQMCECGHARERHGKPVESSESLWCFFGYGDDDPKPEVCTCTRYQPSKQVKWFDAVCVHCGEKRSGHGPVSHGYGSRGCPHGAGSFSVRLVSAESLTSAQWKHPEAVGRQCLDCGDWAAVEPGECLPRLGTKVFANGSQTELAVDPELAKLLDEAGPKPERVKWLDAVCARCGEKRVEHGARMTTAGNGNRPCSNRSRSPGAWVFVASGHSLGQKRWERPPTPFASVCDDCGEVVVIDPGEPLPRTGHEVRANGSRCQHRWYGSRMVSLECGCDVVIPDIDDWGDEDGLLLCEEGELKKRREFRTRYHDEYDQSVGRATGNPDVDGADGRDAGTCDRCGEALRGSTLRFEHGYLFCGQLCADGLGVETEATAVVTTLVTGAALSDDATDALRKAMNRVSQTEPDPPMVANVKQTPHRTQILAEFRDLRCEARPVVIIGSDGERRRLRLEPQEDLSLGADVKDPSNSKPFAQAAAFWEAREAALRSEAEATVKRSMRAWPECRHGTMELRPNSLAWWFECSGRVDDV